MRLTQKRGAADPVLIALVAVIAIGAGVPGTLGLGLSVVLAGALFAIAAMTVLLIVVDRIELALLVMVPLLAFVREEPAPVDLLSVATLCALFARGELLADPPPALALVSAWMLVLSSLIAVLFAPALGGAIAHTATTVHLIAFAFVTYRLVLRGGRLPEHAYVAAGLVAVAMTIIALLPVPFADALHYDTERVQGFFKDPNVFGPFAIPAITIMMVSPRPRSTLLRLGIVALLLLPIAASESRGAFLALGAAVAALGIVSLYRHWSSSLAMVGSAAVLGLIVVATLSFAPDSSHSLFKEQSYDANRFAASSAGLDYLAENPFSLGLGPGNAADALGTANDIHETYLRILVETGPLGLLGLITMLWLTLSAIRVARPDTIAWVAALCGFLVGGLFIDIFHWRHFWFVSGVTIAHGVRAAVQHVELAGIRPSVSTLDVVSAAE